MLIIASKIWYLLNYKQLHQTPWRRTSVTSSVLINLGWEMFVIIIVD